MTPQWIAYLTVPVVSSAGASSTDPTTFLSNFGQFAAAIAIAWYLLGRSDKQITAERRGHREETDLLRKQLAAEQAAHDETMKRLLDHLDDTHRPESL